MMGMTHNQAKLLAFLTERQHAGGAMPTYQEMANATGILSKASIFRMLDALEERGRIRRLGQRPRAIEVIEEPKPGLAIDDDTVLALNLYCHVTGIPPRVVLDQAVRAFLRDNPVPEPAGRQ